MVLYRIKSSAILLRCIRHMDPQNRNSAVVKNAHINDKLTKINYNKFCDNKHDDKLTSIPTKSLCPVASILLMLIPSKASSAEMTI